MSAPQRPIKEITWRESDVSEMTTWVEPLLPRIGVSEPFDISFTDVLGIPVHITLTPRNLHAALFEPLKEWGELELITIQKGKGVTAAQSRLSCMIEAIERYSGANHALDGRTEIASYNEIASKAINPAEFYLPESVSFDADRPLIWYRGRDLVSGDAVCAPIDFVLIDFPDSAFPFEGFESRRLGFYLSNGLCAGESVDDALISGILETAERDVQFRLAKAVEPLPVELAIEGDDHFGAYTDLFQSKGLTLRTFCCDQIEGVYTVIAASFDPYCKTLFQGSATSTDLRVALQQAILELAQQRAWVFFYHRRTRRELSPIMRFIKEQVHPNTYATEIPPSHWTERCRGPVPLNEAEKPLPSDRRSVVETFSKNHRIVAYDLTHPDLGIPVVRTIVSGFENGYFHYNPVVSFQAE